MLPSSICIRNFDMETQDRTITLGYVVDQVAIWRRQKKHKFQAMPENLKILIAKLFPLYSKGKIASTLKITTTKLYNFEKLYSNNKSSDPRRRRSQTNDNGGIKMMPKGTRRPLRKISSSPEDQKMNFIPFQLSSFISPPNDSVINTAVSTTCEIIKTDGTKMILNTNNPAIIIQSFLCCNSQPNQ